MEIWSAPPSRHFDHLMALQLQLPTKVRVAVSIYNTSTGYRNEDDELVGRVQVDANAVLWHRSVHYLAVCTTYCTYLIKSNASRHRRT